ncbi:hypothetical protein ACIG0D_00900 [Streptomyces sp. NPDC052773]|uniref:hypothetical protein n=1 Tax=Streptomyces sp. NPDC052773 TaxID=3365693 RepID=UPI0037CF778E
MPDIERVDQTAMLLALSVSRPDFRRARTYLLSRVRHAVFGYKPDISSVICHELPSFAAHFRRSR